MTTVTNNPGINRAIGLLASPESVGALSVLIVHIGAVLAYFVATDTVVSHTRAVIPVAWTAGTAWLIIYLHRHRQSGDGGLLALVVGIVYFLLLGGVSGMFGFSRQAAGLRVAMATPGWGPVVLYAVGTVRVVIVPYEAFGYLAISYGVYRAVGTRSRGAFGGVIGLFSCVSCSLSLLGALVGMATGTTTAALPGSSTYVLSTGIFLLTVGVLAVAVPTRTA